MSNIQSADSPILFLSELDRVQLGTGPESNQLFFKLFEVNNTIYNRYLCIIIILPCVCSKQCKMIHSL